MDLIIPTVLVLVSRCTDANAVCSGMQCSNGGTVSEDGNYCHCLCMAEFSGNQCEYRLLESNWPQGPYALPMGKDGCPETIQEGWYTGYINMTFTTPFSQSDICREQTNMSNVSADDQLHTDISGPYNDFNLQMNFCYKSETHVKGKGTWIRELFYGAENGCPSGFYGQLSSIYLPPILQWNADGYLPYFDVISEEHQTRLQFVYCVWANDSTNAWDFAKLGDQYMYIKNRDTGCHNSTRSMTYPFKLYDNDCQELHYCSSFNMSRKYERQCDVSPCRHFMFDTGRSHIFKDLHLQMDVLPQGEVIPDIMVYNDKWSFYNNGGQYCQVLHVRFVSFTSIVTCKRLFNIVLYNTEIYLDEYPAEKTILDEPIGEFNMVFSAGVLQGRYIVLLFKSSLWEEHMLDIVIPENPTGVTRYGKTCFESLGMEDFHIQDYQLRASSSITGYTPNMARPQRSGWCAAKDDSQPYLQVDVLTITTFEGIIIYNWEKVTVGNYTNNRYSSSGILQGAYRFSILFGSSDSHMKLYKERNFEIDLSRPFSEPQTFQFVRPFLARFVRVYPSSHMSSKHMCLKLELLGCKQQGIHSLQCTGQSQKEIIQTANAHVPVSNNYTNLTNVTLDYCKDMCLDYHTTCIAVQYSSSFNICKVFFSDNRHNYHEVRANDIFDYLATVNCISGIIKDGSLLKEERLITSVGYPLEYGSMGQHTYTLQEHQTRSIKLIFTDISFKQQKGKEEGVHLSPCQEGILLNDEYNGVDNGKITNVQNGMRMAIITERSESGMIARSITCYSSTWKPESQPSRGFRAHVIVEDTPTCTMHNTSLMRTCQHPSMRLQTFTLMGYPSKENRKYTWSIIPSVPTDTIEFTFSEFYITCQTDSRVTIVTAFGVVKNYCNDNRPIGHIYLTTPSLYVTTHTSLILQNIVLEGFGLQYSSIKQAIAEHSIYDTFGREIHICTFENPEVCRYITHGNPSEKQFRTYRVNASLINQADADGNPNGHFMMIYSPTEINGWIELPVQSPKRYYRYWFIPGGYVYGKDGSGSYNYEILYTDVWQMSDCSETDNGQHGTKIYVKGKYRVFAIDNILLLDNCSDLAVDDVRHVCSGTFGKCYSFHFERKRKSWIDAAQLCTSLNSSLVRIGSLAEVSLLKSVFLEYWFNRRSWKDQRVIPYVHIGLSRYIGENGAILEAWTDGRLLTYSAWEKYEPTNVYQNRCTRMKVQHYNSTGDWSSEPCDTRSSDDGAAHFICEQPYKNNSFQNEWQIPIGERLKGTADPDGHVENSTLFYCSSGESISILSVCNGIAECLSASDEADCKRVDSSCGDNSFQCKNGDCVHISVVCDHIPDCRDASDEYCTHEPCVENEEFPCENGQCIPLYQRCDATNQCLDKSDELNCDACNATTAFQCDSLVCIPARMVCDNVIDCQDGSDETSCTYLEYKTCDDVLKAGFKESGTYTIVSGQFVQCEFDEVKAGIITMSYFNIDWKVLIADKEYVTNSMTFFKYALNDNYICTQDFTPSLKPLEAEIAKLDNLTYPEYEMPAIFEIDLSSKEYGYPVINHTYLEVSVVERSEYNLRVFVHTSFDTQRFRVPSNPVVCTKKDAVCETGFVKCPDSYCIPEEYVCNGRIDCANGNDEIGCWCEDTDDIFVVAVSEQSAYEQEQAFDIASKYVNHVSDVYIVTVGATGLRSMRRLIYPSERVVSVYDNYTHALDLSLLMKNSGTNEFVFISVNLQEINEDVEKSIISTARNNEWKSELLFFRLLIDTEMSNAVRVSVFDDVHNMDAPNLNPRVTEVRIQNRNHLITAGSLLFPGICRGKSKRNCDGGYVCMFSRICISQDRLCDSFSDCPHGDDERLCSFICPSTCNCDGLTVYCSDKKFTWPQLNSMPTETRLLDLSFNSKLKGFPHTLNVTFPFLAVLNVSHSGVEELSVTFFKSVGNLRILDCRFNHISKILKDSFKGLKYLIQVYLEGNKFLKTIEPGAFFGLHIRELSLRNGGIRILETHTFIGLDLTYLDLSHNNIKKIEDLAFDGLSTMKLDMTSNPIKKFGKELFKGITLLNSLKTPSYKLCCVRPEYLNGTDCEPHEDEFSSCDDLMRNSVLQALLWIIGVLAIVGNISSLIFRLIFDRERLKIGYGIFVTNLAFADLLMGIYLLIIAVADVIYRDRYILVDEYWRSSGWCNFCGVISTVSSEASVLFICLITIDRIIVIKYPFGQIRIQTKSGMVLSGICWIIVSFASVIPIIYDDYFEGRFYSSRAVCTALPLTRDRPPGWMYSIVIFIGFNLIAFVLIAFGQCLIFGEVRKASQMKKKLNVSRSNDLTVARNLLLVVTTDFISWFPIGCMGVLAMAGIPIPSGVYAWTVVLILPINSALNPVMYTYSVWMGGRKLNPRVEEQSYTDGSKDTSQAIQTVCQGLYDGIKKRRDLHTVGAILLERKLTPMEIVYIARRLLEYLDHLHDVNLVIEDIDVSQMLIQVDKMGNMTFGDVYLLKIPHAVRSPTDKAATMKKVGLFIQRVMN